MDADQILAFRLARSGLVLRSARGLAEAAACPASDFARDAALLALAARAEDVSREAYDRAVDAGDQRAAVEREVLGVERVDCSAHDVGHDEPAVVDRRRVGRA